MDRKWAKMDKIIYAKIQGEEKDQSFKMYYKSKYKFTF